MKNELQRIRDQLKCSLNMGGLKGSAEWAVGKLDRLLAGVPDVSVMARVLSDRSADACNIDRTDNWAMYGQEYIEDVQAMLAAPTVKAEQDGMCNADNPAARCICREEFGERVCAPSLPADGSAVETTGEQRYRVEPRGKGFWPYCVKAGDGERELYFGHNKDCDRVSAELATAFEDGKYITALSAQQSACERVSVPVWLVESAANNLQLHAEESSHPGQYALIAELRAILASHGRGEA